MEEKIDKLGFIKKKNIYPKKYTFKRMKKRATDWDKIVAKCISDKALLSKIYEELLKLKNKKTYSSIKMGKGSKQTSHQRR